MTSMSPRRAVPLFAAEAVAPASVLSTLVRLRRSLRSGQTINHITSAVRSIAGNAHIHLSRGIDFNRLGNHIAGVNRGIRGVAGEFHQD